MQTAGALKYAKMIAGGLSLVFLLGCAQPDFKGETARERYPASNKSRLDVKMSGYAEKDMKKLSDELGDLVKNLPESKEPYHMRDIDFSSDKGTVRLRITEESGWLPEKYVKMLNEARDKGYFLSYGFYEDGVSCNEKTVMKRPVVVLRKINGLYDICIYENMDDANLANCINFIKYNDAESLGKAIQAMEGVARTNWPKPPDHKDSKLITNPRVRIRTNKGVKEIVAPYAIQMKEKTIIVIDEELKRCLKDDELPKYFEVLKE